MAAAILIWNGVAGSRSGPPRPTSLNPVGCSPGSMTPFRSGEQATTGQYRESNAHADGAREHTTHPARGEGTGEEGSNDQGPMPEQGRARNSAT